MYYPKKKLKTLMIITSLKPRITNTIPKATQLTCIIFCKSTGTIYVYFTNQQIGEYM